MATEERKSTVWEYTEMNRKLRKKQIAHMENTKQKQRNLEK